MKRPKSNLAGSRAKATSDTPTLEATEHKVDLLIRDIWNNGTDMRVVNTDAKCHSVKTPEKCLQEDERSKKKMYLEECLICADVLCWIAL